MQIEVTAESLAGKKLFVATPMYGGQCAGSYTKSSTELAAIAGRHNIDVRFYYLFNESLITRARNYCVDEFLRSDCTHMIFIDSDIGFNARDVIVLLHLCDLDNDMGVVTGPYPKKTIAWEKIKRAFEMGVADKNPFELENYVGDYVFNTPPHVKEIRLDTPVEISEGGTGFMMIDRKVFDTYLKAFPEMTYKPDHLRSEHFDGSREIGLFFDTVVDPVSRRYLSEDYMFCRKLGEAGVKIWLCPWMHLAHVGMYTFGGSLAHLAQVRATPTAGGGSNRKNYKD